MKVRKSLIYAKMKPILCHILTLVLVASFTTYTIASSRKTLSHEKQRILGYSRQHYVNGKLLLKNRDLSILLLSIINIIFILKLLVAFTAHVVAVKRDAVAGQRNGGAVKIKVYVPAGVAIHIANNMQLA